MLISNWVNLYWKGGILCYRIYTYLKNMKIAIYVSVALTVITVVVVNMVLAVDYNVAKIYVAWEEKRAEYDNCFKAFGIADIQIKAVIERWSNIHFTMEEVCAERQRHEPRYDILLDGNDFVSVVRKKNAHLCRMEEELLTKVLSI